MSTKKTAPATAATIPAPSYALTRAAGALLALSWSFDSIMEFGNGTGAHLACLAGSDCEDAAGAIRAGQDPAPFVAVLRLDADRLALDGARLGMNETPGLSMILDYIIDGLEAATAKQAAA